MADLFLDAAYLEIVGAEKVAERVRPSGYSRDQLREIFRNEAGPAFSFNLLDIAGEWAGWDTDFVRERILSMLASKTRRVMCSFQYWLVGRSVYRDWLKVEGVL